MTKFEEEFKALTSWDWVNVDLIQQILTRFGNWHSDEEFQELLDKYSNLNNNYEKEVIKSSKLESQIIGLKSQLQQQALPVVPECVGNFLSGKSIFKIANGDIPDDVISWVQVQTYYVDLEKIISHLISIKVTGFTVEKPQLFYLKHIDMSKRDKDHDYFAQIRNDRFEHDSVRNNTLPGVEVVGVKFTQQEIDSMQTGSYEQIPVPVEDNK